MPASGADPAQDAGRASRAPSPRRPSGDGVATEELGDSARDGLRALDLQQVTDALHGQVLELRQPRAQQARAVDEQRLSLGAQHRQDRL
jgi:hypothetical protein